MSQPHSEAPLLARQQAKLLEGSHFIHRAVAALDAADRRAAPLPDELQALTRSDSTEEALLRLKVFAKAFREGCVRDRLDWDLLSLCIFTAAGLWQHLMTVGLEAVARDLEAALPSLNLPLCRRLYERERLANMPAAGSA
jgi:hypothetical protein